MMASYQPKRVFVTGGAGFIGCNFVRYLLRERSSLQVVNFDALTYAGNLDNLADVMDSPRHTFVRGDITDRAAVANALAGCDTIINIAAETHVDRSIMDSGPFMQTNVVGTQVLLDCAREAGISRFIQLSTDEVYGPTLLDEQSSPFTEQALLRPSSPYAASKAAGDVLALSYHTTFGLPVCVTRASNIFGPFQHPEKVIPLFTLNLLAGKRVPLYGDGRHIRDWLHVEDLVTAILAVLERGATGEMYNVGGENARSNLELTHALLDLTGRDTSYVEHVEDRPGHDRRYAIDSSKIRTKLDWHPKRTDWSAALADTVQWYRENEAWWSAIISGEYREYYDRQYGHRGKTR